MTPTRQCTKCGTDHPLEHFVPRRKSQPEDLHPHCRTCRTAAQLDWARRNPEKVRAYQEKWRIAHPHASRDRYRRKRAAKVAM